jgi:hypothetical protein
MIHPFFMIFLCKKWNPNGKRPGLEHPNNSSVFIVAVASRSMAAGATCGKKITISGTAKGIQKSTLDGGVHMF